MGAATKQILAVAFAAALATFPDVGLAANPEGVDGLTAGGRAVDGRAVASCSTDLTVPITIYNGSHMPDGDLDAVLQRASGLWEPYGITLVAVHEHGVRVIVADGLSDESRSNPSRMILGTTMFTDGHANPYIHLWVGAAEQLLEFDGVRPASTLTLVEHAAALQPILGVALAHELGHYLLDTPRHAHDGLLNDVVSVHDFQHPTFEHLRLTAGQQHTLCATPAVVQKVEALKR